MQSYPTPDKETAVPRQGNSQCNNLKFYIHHYKFVFQKEICFLVHYCVFGLTNGIRAIFQDPL